MDHHSKPVPETPRAENRSDKPDDGSRTIQKWNQKDWDRDTFETDEQESSLTRLMKLAYELSLLKDTIEIYQNFNAHLGCKHHRSTADVPGVLR